MPPRLHHAKPQPTARPLVEKSSAKKESGPRFVVGIERTACSLLDDDNYNGGCKGLIDLLRRAGFIPNDDPATVRFEWTQTKAANRAAQGMRISITDTQPPTP